MGNNIYDMLNDNSIDLEGLDRDGFNLVEKKEIEARFNKSINKNEKKSMKKGIMAASIVLAIAVGTVGSGFGTSVTAAIKLVTTDIGLFLGINKDLGRYKTVVDQSKSNEAISVQLNEVILNGDELVVSTTFKNEKGDLKIESINAVGEVFINGVELSESSSGVGKLAEDSTFQQVMTYSLKDNELKGDLAIKIVYPSVLLNGEVTNIKPYVFEFNTNGDKLAADTIKLSINHSFTLENGSIVTLKDYVSNKVSTKLFLDIDNVNKSEVVYDIQLRGHDNCGNKVVFKPRIIGEDQGILELSTALGEEISDEATEITLTPYAAAFPEGNGIFNSDLKQVEKKVAFPGKNQKLANGYRQVGKEFTIKIK
ncbi:hypothetical protein J2Z44_002629 [Clostridium punense]|uniref:DUF4179 domain-containing protein n=1 Tax=Clostridium punense TaxID=1054297 RepID=A0ABS4K851_9CLOT|nr:DUF4179 domain-containing protein [Clostridium punense]MBP2022804.1 hypothetical protein [Clostridium punense]